MNKKHFLCKIISFSIMACIIVAMTGCVDNYSNRQLKGDSDGELSYRCAYSAKTSEFKINDVTLTFFFGDQFSSGYENEPKLPYLDLYFYSTQDSIEYKKHFIRRLEDEFVSEKYRIIDGKFNHSEILTIPEELFIGNNGIISFSLNSQLTSDIEDVSLSVVQIYYKVNGQTVWLSNEQIK